MKGFFASEKARIKAPSLSTRNSMPFKHLLGPERDVGGHLPWGPADVNFSLIAIHAISCGLKSVR